MAVIDLKSLLDLGYFNWISTKEIAYEYGTDRLFANNGFSPARRIQKVRSTIEILSIVVDDGVVVTRLTP